VFVDLESAWFVQVWANAWMIMFGGAAEEGLVLGAQQDYFNI